MSVNTVHVHCIREVGTLLSGTYSTRTSIGERDKVFVLDAKSGNNIRGLSLKAEVNGLSAMLFAGKKLNEPIAWHGPIVMNTNDQLRQTFYELQQGTFPPVRAAWDYKRLSTFPKDHPARQQK
jgi:hypothetical protein